MKTILVTIAFISVFSIAKGQQTDTAKHFTATLHIDTTIRPFNPADTDKIFTAVEQEPMPKGGIAAFYQYLAQNMHYPEKAYEKGVQGIVFLKFVIEKDGSISNIMVLKSVSKEIDAEAVRVLRTAPKWDPGMQGGRPVRVMSQVPMSFKLQNN